MYNSKAPSTVKNLETTKLISYYTSIRTISSSKTGLVLFTVSTKSHMFLTQYWKVLVPTCAHTFIGALIR